MAKERRGDGCLESLESLSTSGAEAKEEKTEKLHSKHVVRAALIQAVAPTEGILPSACPALDNVSQHLLAKLQKACLQQNLELAEVAVKSGAQIICFSELCNGPYFALERRGVWLQTAESATTGATVVAMQRFARAHRVALVVPIYELAEDGTRFDSAVVINELGDNLGTARKNHIPHGKNEQHDFHENFYYEPGDGRAPCDAEKNVSSNRFHPVFQTGCCRVGVSICYDRHFEGVMRTLAAEGAEVVFSPAVTFGKQSRRMWGLEFPVDALRHRLFIGGSNRRGVEPPWTQHYFGDSYFCSPTQSRLNQIPSAHEDVVVADLPIHELSDSDGSGWDFARDQRPHILNAMAVVRKKC